MAKIAVLIEDMFEDSEYGKPAEAFEKAGHELVHISVKKEPVKGLHTGKKVKIEKLISEVQANEFDALFIPGGYSPDRLRVDDEVVSFVREFSKSGKPLFFICHGAQLLITADALRGRKVTGYKSIVQDIKNAGAQYLNQEVVEDNNFISSRYPDDIPAFITACLNMLKKYK
ncbi:MAG: type 1 glutamine amidotransferase [Candidatus Omnitrophica bacterium]|nr:type 1 glutamine amidotransferase [Candidatus Omnitrophota bacterium]